MSEGKAVLHTDGLDFKDVVQEDLMKDAIKLHYEIAGSFMEVQC